MWWQLKSESIFDVIRPLHITLKAYGFCCFTIIQNFDQEMVSKISLIDLFWILVAIWYNYSLLNLNVYGSIYKIKKVSTILYSSLPSVLMLGVCVSAINAILSNIFRFKILQILNLLNEIDEKVIKVFF